MKKVLKKTTAALLATVIMMAMCIAPLMAAAAEDLKSCPPKEVGTNVIAKKLIVADMVKSPNVTFEFEFTSLDDDNDPNLKLENAKIAFSSKDVGTKTKFASISEILKKAAYPHAGVYTYKVAEVHNTYTLQPGEEMSYSDSVYYMYVYVENVKNEDSLIITKVLFTDSLDDTCKKESICFVNTYGKSIKNALYVTKKVTGAYGDKTKKFDFSVKVNKTAANELDADELFGYVDSAKDVPIKGTKNDDDGSITIKFKLAHGEYFYIDKLYVGTTYTVTENSDEYEFKGCTLFINNSTFPPAKLVLMLDISS